MKQYDRFFEQGRNCAGDLGHNTIQKVNGTLRMMAYGVPADFIDNNLTMGKSTSILRVNKFAKAVVKVFGAEYLRASNAHDTQRILEMNKTRGFLCLDQLIGCTEG